MSDERSSNPLVERLRYYANNRPDLQSTFIGAKLEEAADEIERLTAELEEFKQCYREDGMEAIFAERDRLRVALERCATWMNARVGNTWEAHDAVDPTLWDELKLLGVATFRTTNT